MLIHLSIDRFEPDLMLVNPEDPEEYIITRMVPPKQIEYYFSVNNVARYRVDTESESASKSKYPDLKSIEYKGGSIPWRVNIAPPGAQNTVPIDLDYLTQIN